MDSYDIAQHRQLAYKKRLNASSQIQSTVFISDLPSPPYSKPATLRLKKRIEPPIKLPPRIQKRRDARRLGPKLSAIRPHHILFIPSSNIIVSNEIRRVADAHMDFTSGREHGVILLLSLTISNYSLLKPLCGSCVDADERITDTGAWPSFQCELSTAREIFTCAQSRGVGDPAVSKVCLRLRETLRVWRSQADVEAGGSDDIANVHRALGHGLTVYESDIDQGDLVRGLVWLRCFPTAKPNT